MGSVQVECPLCCNETFTSYSSLKYHLLSIVDNLTCTVCSKRFDRIVDLAEHLGRECRDVTAAEEEEEDDSNVPPQEVAVKSEFNSDGEPSMGDSILAKALMKKTDGGRNDAVKTTTAEPAADDKGEEDRAATEDVYYCSSCATNFTAINEHLEKYHEGQEVYIEDAGSGEIVSEEDGQFLVVQNKETHDGEDTNESEEFTDANDTVELYNTLKQEDILDKDGRLYTRKVVQIEKFWTDSDNAKQPPITQKYVLDNGKAIKMDDSVAAADEKNILSIHQCALCSLHFCKLDQYYGHKCSPKEDDGDANDEHTCPKCNGIFSNAKSLSNHMRTHKSEKQLAEHAGPYICETCTTEFPTYKSLRLHKRMHDPVKVKQIEPPVTYGLTGEGDPEKEAAAREMFECHLCHKVYDKQYEEVHMKSHSNETRYDCEICNRKFFTQSNLQMHMRVHSNGKKFVCSYCKKGFLSYESLQQHIKLLCQSRPYECQYCGRRFMRPHEKVKHERIHTGEKPHVCEICGKAFRVSYCLTLHMRTHSGTRPYQCVHCGKRFKAHSVYNHHILTHSSLRNYKCPYCPKAFKTGVQLAGHKNSHTKPFTCTECNRPFASLYAVRAHMDTHKRENNLKFSCWLCGASYARAFALRDHVKEHHAGEAWNKDVELMEPEYEMVSEGVSASNSILNEESNNDVLVVLEHDNIDNVEMVEEVTTVN